MAFKKVCIDIETNMLLEPALNYLSMPYRLKPEFKIWCIVITDMETYEHKILKLEECNKENIKEILKETELIIGHNHVSFDLPVLRLLGLIDYRIGYPGEVSKLYDRDCEYVDTMILSKLLDPDRHGKHSLQAWGLRVGDPKIDFHDFSQPSEEMFTYCIQDCVTCIKTYYSLLSEIGKPIEKSIWKKPFQLEQKIFDLTLKQSVFGFYFNDILAKKCIAELDQLMAEIRAKINPLLPPKKMNKGEAKFYEWPKNIFKKDGDISAIAYKWAEKIGGKIVPGFFGQEAYLEFNNTKFSLQEKKSLEVLLPGDVDDIDHIKHTLIENYNWVPNEFKERDLFKKPDKSKKTEEEMFATIERYVKQTFSGLFAEHRCDILEVDCNPEALQAALLQRSKKSKSLWVPTTPKITIGLEKNICPSIEKLGEKAEFVKDLVKYLTYKHRRNSILGGDIDYDPTSDEEIEPTKGFLFHQREDKRITTSCDPLGTNTCRTKHRVVCNIPRCTTLYGEPMRALFGAGPNMIQIGYDHASLEGRVEGSYVYTYTDGPNLAKSLIAEKPNDIHSLTAKKVGIPRQDAKSLVYASIYGAQPKKIGKMLGCDVPRAEKIHSDFWDSVPALKELKEKVEEHWIKNGKKWIRGLDGRQLVTRSKHALINVLFQGAGAIFVKWCLVISSQLLEKHNLLGNPFIDNIDSDKLFHMITNHDECQYATKKNLINIRTFPTEEEAKKNRKYRSSAIGHGSKGYYLAYETLPITCIYEAIAIAQKELGMRVDMGIEWNVGLNWAQTH